MTGKTFFKPGDIGLTTNSGLLARMIRKCDERIYGDPACYSHAFVIIDGAGSTFESGITNKIKIFGRKFINALAPLIIGMDSVERFVGQKVLIARHRDMNSNRFMRGLTELTDNLGQTYPLHRLFLFLLGVTWFRIKEDWPVCSELAAQFAVKAGVITQFESWQGVSPDTLHDLFQQPDSGWRIVFEGIWNLGWTDENKWGSIETSSVI